MQAYLNKISVKNLILDSPMTTDKKNFEKKIQTAAAAQQNVRVVNSFWLTNANHKD